MKSDNARTDKTITQLKNNKAPGPDKIPNEIFTHANHQTREIYLKKINKLIQTYKIPDQWQIVEIKKNMQRKGKTYGGETWEMTKQEEKRINQIQENIIRRIFMAPQSTPTESLYIKTGLLDIATI